MFRWQVHRDVVLALKQIVFEQQRKFLAVQEFQYTF